MKSDEEIMDMLEAFDLTGSYRAAAELAGVDHHTVERYVALRDGGRSPSSGIDRPKLIDPLLPKIEEWVERSHGKIRADRCHEKLIALGYEGSERTTRRAVAGARQRFREGRLRVYRPWIPEPGMWFQWDYGTGPEVPEGPTQLFCAWLAWSRYRVVFPILDKTLPTVVAGIDRTLRAFGGVPTYGLTDNEKTVTTTHIARIPVRHPEIVAAARHYGLTIATCVPADPESKGGSEATVRIAKADLVPTEANLLPAYRSFEELRAACEAFCERVNARPHRATGRPPAELLAEERRRLHPVPGEAYTTAFGQTRTVASNSVVSFHSVLYSVPYSLIGRRVWVRTEGDQVVVVSVDPSAGAREVARHRRSTPGRPMIDDAHYPQRPSGPLARVPRARTPEEQAFLALGNGATQWLIEAASVGAARIRSKMAEALELSKLYGPEALDRALGTAATCGRFADGDLAAILAHDTSADGPTSQATEAHSLQRGTTAWEGFGR